jgi:CxxC motif-containing protein
LPRLPVKTARPVPKGAIMACMRVIRGVSVDAPVAMGAVIVEDLAGTGVQLVATRSMLAAE